MKTTPYDRRARALLLCNGEPMLQCWMGHFFEPFFSDPQAVREGLRAIRRMGFNAVQTDSKGTENFFSRARGEPADPYVAMQERMLKGIRDEGMRHSALAIYCNGDNLYPSITDSPAARGEEPVDLAGRPMGTYRLDSPRAQRVMLAHVRNLMRLYGKGHVELAAKGPRKPVQIMFDPIYKPSFDARGRKAYLTWLKRRYRGSIAALNARYGLRVRNFESLKPEQYWFKPEALTWITCAYPEADAFARRAPDVFKWADHQQWLAERLVAFFRVMKRKYRTMDPSLFLQPALQQWGMLFNPLDASGTDEVLRPLVRGWCSGLRALDPYRIRPHTDGALFISAPLNPEGDPDAYALSVEFSLARAAHGFEPFIAGLYLGRHVCCDIYKDVSPAEALGTLVAHGARGAHVYGFSGLDDGGVLFKMDALFQASVREGNRWARRVIPMLEGERPREIALLFPLAMHLLEPALLPGGAQRRMDTLGWYRQFVDLGYHVDVVHPDQVKAGALEDYAVLVLPEDSAYDLMPDAALERALRAWVRRGGTLMHGPAHALAHRAFGLVERPVERDCVAWPERLIPHGWSTVAYPEAEPWAVYERLGLTAIGRTALGAGAIYSFGFPYGYAYGCRVAPNVPAAYGRHEAYPVSLLGDTPPARIAHPVIRPRWPGTRGIEAAWFGNGVVVVNHRSVPFPLEVFGGGTRLPQLCAAGDMLMPHSAVFIRRKRSRTANAKRAKPSR